MLFPHREIIGNFFSRASESHEQLNLVYLDSPIPISYEWFLESPCLRVLFIIIFLVFLLFSAILLLCLEKWCEFYFFIIFCYIGDSKSQTNTPMSLTTELQTEGRVHIIYFLSKWV